MTTHDSLAMRIAGDSCYETKFQKMLSMMQTDASLLRLFLGNPGPRLTGMCIPVVKSVEDFEFASTCSDDTDTGSEMLQIKLHWWGVNAIIGGILIQLMQDGMGAAGELEQIISPSTRGD